MIYPSCILFQNITNHPPINLFAHIQDYRNCENNQTGKKNLHYQLLSSLLIPTHPTQSTWACITETQEQGAYKQPTCIPHSSRGWESKIKVPVDSVSRAGMSLGSQTAVFSLGPHMGRNQGALWSLFLCSFLYLLNQHLHVL